MTGWKGTPRGHEGQALAWVAPDKLMRYAMPPADRPVVAALLHPDRYLVTPEPTDIASWLASLERALAQGVRRVQIRARSLSGDAWLAFLDRTGQTTTFSQGPGQALADLAYEPNPPRPAPELVAAVRHWIRHHRPAGV